MQPHQKHEEGAALMERLRTVGLKLTRKVNSLLVADGLSYTRARILYYIERDETARAIDLARSFDQAPRTVTEAIDGLERDGFLTRATDAEDRRVKRLIITSAGREAVARSLATGLLVGDALADALGSGGVEALSLLLDRIEGHLAEE